MKNLILFCVSRRFGDGKQDFTTTVHCTVVHLVTKHNCGGYAIRGMNLPRGKKTANVAWTDWGVGMDRLRERNRG